MNYGHDTSFGPSQFAGAGYASQAPGVDGGVQKGARPQAQTMRDVTVRQLIRDNASNNDEFKVDGVELTTFFIVGRIVSRAETSNAIKLKVDDGTGIIEASFYKEDSNEALTRASAEWVTDVYVRVAGSLRVHENQKGMLAFRIKKITDFNEVTHHNLQCLFQHLHLTKGNAPPGAAPQLFGASAPSAAKSSHAPVSQSGGSQFQDQVLAVYCRPAVPENGFSLDEVVSALTQQGVQCTKQSVTEAVEFLSNQGHLYSTINEEHHRSTSV